MASAIVQEQRKINKWPAKRLAPNRNPKVKGWIKRLILSIITITGIKYIGVPCGKRCLIFLFHLFFIPAILTIIHKGKDKAKVNLRCEVWENV